MAVALTHWPVCSWASGSHFEAKVSHELMPLKYVFGASNPEVNGKYLTEQHGTWL